MPIYILDDSLSVDVYHECSDEEFRDNICLSITESCPQEERIFRYEETNIYLTPEQARSLAMALLAAVENSCE